MLLELILLDSCLMIYPLSLMARKKVIDIKENKGLFYFTFIYLLIISFVYCFQSILGLYMNFVTENFEIFIGLCFFMLSLIIIIRLFLEHLDKKIYYMIIMIFLFTLFLFTFSLYYTPSPVNKIKRSESTSSFIIMIIATSIGLGTLFLFKRFLKKREFKFEISEKDLKGLIYYFAIALGIIFVIGTIQYFIFYKAQYSGFIEISDIGDKIWAVMGSIIFEPFFMITAIFTMLGAVVRVIGIGATKLFGNIVMAFLPMILWMQYFFGETPEEIVDIFLGWEWFGKIFHIVLTTMLLVMIISVWNIFTSIIMITS